MRAKITKRTVDAARSEGRDTFIWDSETKGFGLKVTAAGNKVYVTQGRLKDTGELIRCTIGKHGSPWTPDQARDEATRLLVEMASGINPNKEKKAARDALTVTQLCKLYLDEGCDKKKPSTVSVERGLIERHIKPLLGKKRVPALARADIERFMADVASGKTATDEKTRKRGRAIVRGGKGTANRTTDLLASMLTFAVRRDLRPDNPAKGIQKYRLKPRERFLSSKEVARLGEVFEQAEREYKAAEERHEKGEPNKSGRKGASDPPRGENPYAVAAIRALMLTGCRKNEILSLKWDWIDFDHNVIRLPDSKTGAKTITLTAPVQEILTGLSRIDGNPHVFPSSVGDGHIVGLQKIWVRLREKADLSDVRIHDLRHSFASFGVAGGDPLFVIGKLLGHTQARTTERYAHLEDDPIRAANDRIAGHIAAIMNGKDAEIVDFKERNA